MLLVCIFDCYAVNNVRYACNAKQVQVLLCVFSFDMFVVHYATSKRFFKAASTTYMHEKSRDSKCSLLY